MGTRGVIGFVKNGELKVAYNHWDSYPECLGIVALDFAVRYSVDDLNEMCDRLEVIDTDIPPTEDQIQKCRDAGTVNLSVSERSENDWYCLLRGAQGDFESYVELGLIPDSSGFMKDSLFCEWGYVINLDDKTLDVYMGLDEGEQPTDGLFAGSTECNRGYYPVNREQSLPLNSLAEMSNEDFIALFSVPDDEDEE